MCSTATPPPPSIRSGNTREQAIFGADTQFYGWHYLPYFLGFAALLAAMPYALALALWQGGTFALYSG